MNWRWSGGNVAVATFFLAAAVVVLSAENVVAETEYTNYTMPSVNWSSTAGQHPRGMQPFYEMTNRGLSLLERSDKPIPEGYIVVTKGKVDLGPKINENQYGDVLKEHWGIVLIVAICAAIIVLAPIIGLCFCCCRCAGSCGGRSEPFDKKHDTCRRIFLGILLICAGTGLVFGVVITFMTNNYIQQGVENVTVTSKASLNDTQQYLNITSKQIDYLLVNNFGELNDVLNKMLDDAAQQIVIDLEKTSKAVSVTQLNEFVQSFPHIRDDLSEIKQLSIGLKNNASDLNAALRKIKNELLQTLNNCSHPSCSDIVSKYEIGQLGTDIQYDTLPDVTDFIDDVSNQMSSELMDQLSDSQGQIEEMKSDLQVDINENVQKIKEAMNNASRYMGILSTNINDKLREYSGEMDKVSNKYLDTADEYINTYSIYRFYMGLGVGAVLLLILLCVIFGLLCGICGKRPDGYGDDCCNKGAGSRFLMIGVAVVFLTISILTIIVLVHFIAGLLVHRFACISLRHPEGDQLIEYIDKFLDLHELYPKSVFKNRHLKAQRDNSLKIADIIGNCKRNQSAIEVFHLKQYLEIDSIRNYPPEDQIRELLQKLIDGLNVEKNVSIIDPKLRDRMAKLANSNLNNFDSRTFEQYLSDNITQINLSELSNKLRQTAESMPKTRDLGDVAVNLRHYAIQLNAYDRSLVHPMVASRDRILELTKKLDESFKFKQKSFKSAIQKFSREAEEAERFINSEGTPYIRAAIKNLTEEFLGEIASYKEMVFTRVNNDVGRCGPLYNAFDSMIVTSCNKIVDPFNTFWAGVAWCILLFLPTIIISAKLSSLYQKSDPYPGPLVENEYLYDAYSERDNIPLANGSKNKRRKKYDRRRDQREYYEDSSSSHGPPSSSRDARYTDMAPNRRIQGPTAPEHPGIGGDGGQGGNRIYNGYGSNSNYTNPHDASNHNGTAVNNNQSFYDLNVSAATRGVQIPRISPKPPSPNQFLSNPRYVPKSLKQQPAAGRNADGGYY